MFMWPWPWPMTLILDLDLDTLKCTCVWEIKLLDQYFQKLSKVRARTVRTHTDAQTGATKHFTTPHSRTVKQLTFIVQLVYILHLSWSLERTTWSCNNTIQKKLIRRYPNVTLLCFATPLAFNVPNGGFPLVRSP